MDVASVNVHADWNKAGNRASLFPPIVFLRRDRKTIACAKNAEMSYLPRRATGPLVETCPRESGERGPIGAQIATPKVVHRPKTVIAWVWRSTCVNTMSRAVTRSSRVMTLLEAGLDTLKRPILAPM